MFYICAGMDAALIYTVGDLASDEALRLPCACRVRTVGRDDLVRLVGRDTRLHLVGLRHELWCGECGEPPLRGWVVRAEGSRVGRAAR